MICNNGAVERFVSAARQRHSRAVGEYRVRFRHAADVRKIHDRRAPDAEKPAVQSVGERAERHFHGVVARGMDGVTMARRVRAENASVQIVFITGYTDYIAEGYDVAALHYLVKPVREEKLFEVLDRAAAKLRADSRALTLECGGEIFRVPLYEIRWLGVEKNYTTVHAKRDYTVKKTLGALSDELDERFFRIGRAAIVNLSYIRRVTKTDAILSDGAAIPLPRGA